MQEEFNNNLECNLLFKGDGVKLFGVLSNNKNNTSKYLYNCELEYLYPNTIYIWLISFVIGIIFNLKWLWIGSVFIFILMAFIQSKYFFFLMLKRGLKKKGFKGKIKLVW
jgi:hypothetical protein